ncbi:phage replisome organizer N-terminal domain-containing protein [uncultured Clostridium sp.]|uniref:phage replisome organizer N-terminal domain-containing protein n=1 Tax=uncultured Clostridium sp. TaxID=59620 RepID=UPI0026F34E32|nr:phage replisome organizer N-terminal domain-containing protein [uncultured Clostridium sp.]
MADNKKYYYLKLKENFFDSPEIKVLEAMPNGYKYSNLLLKLYLKSLRFEGMVRLNEYIPYSIDMISAITGIDSDTVRVAFDIFKKLKLIEILDDGTIFMLDIQNFIGKSTTEADRKRKYRSKIEDAKNRACTNSIPEQGQIVGQMSGQMSGQTTDKSTPEIELEKEIELDSSTNSTTCCTKEQLREIVNKWNSLNLQRVMSINQGTNRYKMIHTRIKEYGFETVLQAIDNIKKSSFLRGQNKRNWIISFDWFIKPNNFIKVLEDNYKDKEVKVCATGGIGKDNKSGEVKFDFSRFSDDSGEWNGEDIETEY